jgi:hypothetical protein
VSEEETSVFAPARRLGEEVRERVGRPLAEQIPKKITETTYSFFEGISRAFGGALERLGDIRIPESVEALREEVKEVVTLPKGKSLKDVLYEQPLFSEVVTERLEKTPVVKDIPYAPVVLGFLSEFLIPPYGPKGKGSFVKKLTKDTDPKSISKIIKEGVRDVSEKEADDLGRKLAPIKKEEDVLKELDTFFQAKSPGVEPLAEEARKFKTADEFTNSGFGKEFEKGIEESKKFNDQRQLIEDYLFKVSKEKGLARNAERTVADRVRQGKAPSSVQKAVREIGRDTRDFETGELISKTNKDWPRGGTIIDITDRPPKEIPFESATDFFNQAKKADPRLKERGFITSAKQVVPELETRISGQYIPRSTDALSIKAANLIKKNIDVAEQLAKGTDDEAVAVASELIKHYSDLAERAVSQAEKTVFYDKAGAIINEIAPKLTELGRAVQAASILGRQTPEGQIRFAAKLIRKHNDEIERARKGILGLRKKVPELKGEKLKELFEEAKRIQKMPDGDAKAMAFRKQQDEIAALVPTRWYKKAISLWKSGLLTGIRTSGLNTLSNLFHGVSERISEIPAVAVDSVVALFTGERTIALTLRGYKGGVKEGFDKGWRYLKTGYDERDIAAKLDRTKVNFGKGKLAKAMQTYEQTVFRVLGAQDQPFYYGAKAHSLWSQAVAAAINKGLKGKELKEFAEKLIENPTNKMLKNAVNDAEIAVFHNQTELGKIGRQLQRLGGGAGEFIVPFVRTPSAVAMQLVNYSPVGIARAVVENIGKGRFSQRDFSKMMGRGITGTAIMYVGKELYDADLIATSWPKTERERRQWELEGKKSNSIKIGGKWRTAAVLGPAGLALVVGGHFGQGLKETGSYIGALKQATLGVGESLVEQTFIRGMNAVVEALTSPERYSDKWLKQTAGSVIPTIISDIARGLDPLERRYDTPYEALKARIPGVRETLEPRIDVMGEELIRGGNFIETLIDPTRPSNIKVTEVIVELRRLSDAGHSITPTGFGRREGWKSLTPEQNTRLLQRAGQVLEANLSRLVKLEGYKKASDQEKAKKIKRWTQIARDSARAEMVIEVTKGKNYEETLESLKELRGDKLLTSDVFREYQRIR